MNLTTIKEKLDNLYLAKRNRIRAIRRLKDYERDLQLEGIYMQRMNEAEADLEKADLEILKFLKTIIDE